MNYSKKPLSQTIVALCQAKEIDHIVISPGSRNAPLTIGFTENPFFKCFSIVDERCAAFFALGLSQQLKRPVALVCTSGSALLNYYPAIAEAFYSDIPLVVLSADRPIHMIDIGDGQTIRQENVFANHILSSANCEEGEQHINEGIINEALNIGIVQRGPVHINLPFSEPLYEKVDSPSFEVRNVSASVSSDEMIDDLKLFTDQWNSYDRKIILVGVLDPNSIERKYLEQLAEDPSVLVLTETTSNLSQVSLFPAIDQLIAPLDATGFENLKPDLLLTFGGMIVSKKIKAFLRNHSPMVHWHVDSKKAYDTYFCLSHHFKLSPNTFLENFLALTKPVKSSYNADWTEIREQRRKKHKQYLDEIPFSDFKVFDKIFMTLPEESILQLSNSATIRYSQLFEMKSSVEVYCNRGTSGIDGSTSTAIGAAVATNKSVVFITGDLGFFYDSNGLWNSYIPASFRIIVVNNGGGGIFRILPGEKHSENFDTYFETKHELHAQHLCEMYGFGYEKASNDLELTERLNGFFNESARPKLLEIFTPSQINDKVLLGYFDYLKK